MQNIQEKASILLKVAKTSRVFAAIVFCCFIGTAHAKEKALAGQEQIEVLSSDPYIAIFHQFLTDEECSHLIERGKPHLERSEVIDETSPDPYLSSERTSEGMFIEDNKQDFILNRIENRISQRLSIPNENGEPMQILRYEVGQEFTPHHDYFEPEGKGASVHDQRRNNRLATLLMYLNTPEEGGETIFPLLELKIKPVKGDALIFYNCNRKRKGNPLSLHQGAPVLQGEKWVATKWLRFERFQ